MLTVYSAMIQLCYNMGQLHMFLNLIAMLSDYRFQQLSTISLNIQAGKFKTKVCTAFHFDKTGPP
jgi:hypothetical protein